MSVLGSLAMWDRGTYTTALMCLMAAELEAVYTVKPCYELQGTISACPHIAHTARKLTIYFYSYCYDKWASYEA